MQTRWLDTGPEYLAAVLALFICSMAAHAMEGEGPAAIPVVEGPQQVDERIQQYREAQEVYACNLMEGKSRASRTLDLGGEQGIVVKLQTPPLADGRHRLWVPMRLVPHGDARLHDLGVTILVGDNRERMLLLKDFSMKEEFRDFCLDFTIAGGEKKPILIFWQVGPFAMEERCKFLAKNAPASIELNAAGLGGETAEAAEGLLLEEKDEKPREKGMAAARTIPISEAEKMEVRLELLPPVVEANVAPPVRLADADLLYAPGTESFRLAESGKAGAGIVVSAEVRGSVEPGSSNAPNLLKQELEFVTGAPFRFERVSGGKFPTIEIGLTDEAKKEGVDAAAGEYGRDGFVIRITPKRIFICGPSPSGTAFGIYAFLNNVLRVRKYHPDTSFHCAPYAPDAALPTGEIADRPDFRLRAFSSVGFYRQDCPRSDIWWLAYNGIQYHTDSFPQPYLFHHGMYSIFQAYNSSLVRKNAKRLLETTMKKNPASRMAEGGALDALDSEFEEALADGGGKKEKTPDDLLYEMFDHCLPEDLPKEKRAEAVARLLKRKAGWQPCFSHPETARICTETALDTFRSDPELQAFSVGMNDSGGCCFGEACRERLKGEYLVTQDSYKYWNQGSIYYRFMNDVAEEVEKEFPGKMIGGLCYHYTTSPPRQYKLRENIFLLRNFYLANTPPEWVEKTLAPWEGKIAHLGIYEYAYPTTVPRFNLHNLQPVLQARREKGGNFYYAEVYPDWQIEGPKYWLMTRVLWKNSAEVDALMERYCHDLFGKAAETMLEYWRLCARIVPEMQEKGRRLSPYMNPLSRGVVVYPYIDRMKRLLAEAEAAAESKIVKERIRYFREPVEIDMDLLARIGATFDAAVEPKDSIDEELNAAVGGIVKLGQLEGELGKVTHHGTKLAKRGMPPSSYAGSIGSRVAGRVGSLLAADLRKQGKDDWRALPKAANGVLAAAGKRFSAPPEAEAFALLKEQMARIFDANMTAIPKVQSPLKVDGVAEEAFLKNARKLRFNRFSVVPRGSKEESKPVDADWTEVYLGYDSEAMYFTIRSAEADPAVFEGHSQDGSYAMFTGDAVSFILAPLAGADLALRITIDVRGKVYAWTPPERLAQSYDKEAGVWTVELALPWGFPYFQEHGMKPGTFELLRANVLRHYKTPESQYFRGHGPATRAASWFRPAAASPAGRSPAQTGLLILDK